MSVHKAMSGIYEWRNSLKSKREEWDNKPENSFLRRSKKNPDPFNLIKVMNQLDLIIQDNLNHISLDGIIINNFNESTCGVINLLFENNVRYIYVNKYQGRSFLNASKNLIKDRIIREIDNNTFIYSYDESTQELKCRPKYEKFEIIKDIKFD